MKAGRKALVKGEKSKPDKFMFGADAPGGEERVSRPGWSIGRTCGMDNQFRMNWFMADLVHEAHLTHPLFFMASTTLHAIFEILKKKTLVDVDGPRRPHAIAVQLPHAVSLGRPFFSNFKYDINCGRLAFKCFSYISLLQVFEFFFADLFSLHFFKFRSWVLV